MAQEVRSASPRLSSSDVVLAIYVVVVSQCSHVSFLLAIPCLHVAAGLVGQDGIPPDIFKPHFPVFLLFIAELCFSLASVDHYMASLLLECAVTKGHGDSGCCARITLRVRVEE